MKTHSPLRIVVLGYLVRGPLGGIAWHHLQYVVGLAQLGHNVCFIEDSDDFPSCYDPARNVTDADPGYGLRFAHDAFARLGLPDRWAYFDAHRNVWRGPAGRRGPEICAAADIVLNLSCVTPLRSWFEHVPVRVLVDTDPVFTQVRHLQKPDARRMAADHTAFFSFGERIGQPDCTIPPDGFPWAPTRQPLVLDAWTPSIGDPGGPLTSVMLWGSYAPVQHEGTLYGMKAQSFDPFMTLPRRCTERFELAMGSDEEPRRQLESRGWTVTDPRDATRDPWTYQRFIARSKAEFSVAKHGYVISRSGWFSERSLSYLASGRPVIVQDTAFPQELRRSRGILAFSTAEEALMQIAALNEDYEGRCRDARAVAEEYFAAGEVLSQLLAAATSPQAGALAH